MEEGKVHNEYNREKKNELTRGIYCAFRSFLPPPSFEIHFFLRRISLRWAGGRVYGPKRCIFIAISVFRPFPTNKFTAIGAKIFGVYYPKRCEGRKTPPPPFFFGVYTPKRCILKAFFPFFNVIFLPFSFHFFIFSPNSSFFPQPPFMLNTN